MNRILFVASVLLSLSAASCAHGDEPLEYNRDIRPILAENCFACHGTDSASRKADLRLDQREAAVDFGAITPGSSTESELVARILTDDPDLIMPPPEIKKHLSQQQKEMLQRWINLGAEYQPHWSFIPPSDAVKPSVKNEAWIRNTIDRYVLERLEKEGLSPAGEADVRTLFRRLHLDITGLPPKPTDITAFVADYERRKDLALSEWIDLLMESTAWGEHRARYWLDAARYADTHGLHFDNYREMWPYRDWVIRAFNKNQPFDQFVIEQLAGDLLPQPSDEQLIATGFQRCNITTNEGGTIAEENLAIYAADRVQTFGWVFLGLTTNCAQCHDHKFDPFTARDYYSLAAFFRNTDAPALDGNTKDGQGPVLLVPSEADQPRWAALPAEIANTQTQLEERKELSKSEFDTWLTNATPGVVADISKEHLVLHLPLEEGEGEEVRNLTGSPANFRSTGPVKWQENGKLGAAPLIQKGSTFDLGGHGDFEKDESFSYGAWVKTSKEAIDRGLSAAILARMDQANSHRGWDLWQSGTSLAVHLIDSWDGNALKVTTKQGIITPDKWQHVFATYDGSGTPDGIRIYVDGELVDLEVATNTLRIDASIRAKTPLRIGQRSNDAVFAGGQVQDVRIYHRKLSSQEVRRLAQVTQIRSILAKESEQRTDEDRTVLLDHFLSTYDDRYVALAKTLTDFETEQSVIRSRSPITHIQREKKDSQPMAHILMRGEYDNLGEEVGAATPAALHAFPADVPRNRLGLAKWVVDRANPLTARVTVNRFWQEVFGQGLVSTPEDFGVSGALPSHPELLDRLSIDFVESGWDVKRLFKQMFMSATYRQSAQTSPQKLELDPSNILMSRGPRYRMDAEMVRDAALSASGLLSTRMYGPGARPYQPENLWEIVGLPGGDTRSYVQDKGENLYRRTVYNFWKRMAPPPSMEAFNAPSREYCTVLRERTNTPLQALVMLNDPQFVETARRLAESALKTSGGDDLMALDYIAERTLARTMTTKERAIVLSTKADYQSHYQEQLADAKLLIAVGETLADQKIDVATLAAWTMVCNQVMNLDEALNK